MCFSWCRKSPPPPSAPHPPPPYPSTSRSIDSSIDFSRDSQLSSSSAASLAGIRDLLPDGPIAYSRFEIEAATDHFGASLQIATSVWKGVLRGASVAIVRKQGSANDFKKVVSDVCSVHHSNLVKLLGGCKDGNFVYLVYELVNGEALGSCLRSKQLPGYTVLSSWRSRMQIALDVAKGLEYLQEHTLSRSVHKHITSRNILVVADTLRAKIALVGLAALTGEVKDSEQSQEALLTGRPTSLFRSRSVKIEGTQGYMPPEYLESGVVTDKYDVFAFGVVLLELMKGQEAGQEKANSLIEDMRLIMKDITGSKGKLRLWIDARLRDSYPVEDAMKVAKLANSCVDVDPANRPQMSQVAAKLARIFHSAKTWETQRSTMTTTTILEAR